MNRKQIEAKREQMDLQDPIWVLYTTIGPTYEEIVGLRTQTQPGQTILWTPEKGWEIINAV